MMIINARNILPIGKGPVSVFNNQSPMAKIWVVDMTEKQISILKVTEGLLRLGLLDEFQLFSTYSNVNIIVKSNNRLIANDKILPLPISEPLSFYPSQIFQKLKIPVVKISELGSPKSLSATRNGYYLAYDIRCIENCTIQYSKTHNREYNGWKYKSATISISDGITEGFITKNGLCIPNNFFCWVNPEFAYPINTFGDAYGVLRINQKEKLVFDLCYFDVIKLGEESTAEIEDYNDEKKYPFVTFDESIG